MTNQQKLQYAKLQCYREKYERMANDAGLADYWQFCARQAAKMSELMTDVKEGAVRLVVA